MNIREFVSIFTTTAVVAWIANVAWLAILAAPISWTWNWTMVPFGTFPHISYGRAYGLLLLWFLLRQAHVGLKLSAKT